MSQKIKCVNCGKEVENPIFVQDWTHEGYYCEEDFDRINKGLL